jgi:hypothetical protein
MTADPRSLARENAIAARGELAATLNALEDKFNVRKQFSLAKRRAKLRAQRLWRDAPAVAVVVGVAAVATVGAGVWFIAKRIADD